MKVTITSPTYAIVEFANDKEKADLNKSLTYTNKSISFQISKLKQNRWFKRQNPEGYAFRMAELQAQLKTSILEWNAGHWTIKPGIISYIKDRFSPQIVDEREFPETKKYSWKKKPEFEPYPYQAKAVEQLLKAKHGNISLPTGCGKSFILLMLARELGLRTVVVTPSKSIFNELLKEFQDKLGKNVVGGYGDGKKDIKKPITIAIGRSLTMLKMGTEAWDFFYDKQVMLVDESHTFAASELEKTCHGVLSQVPYRMFVSATQTRGDGTEKMLYSIIGENVLDMEIYEAINKGYLCPLKFTVINTFSPSTLKKKDPLECKREHFLYNKEIAKLIARIANGSVAGSNESTLVLVEELRQIQELLPLLKVPYAYVHSGSKKEAAKFGLETVKLQQQVDRFNNGEVKVLIGTRAISTGTNMYPTHNTCNWVGGNSEIITKQGTMGRSTRKLEISKYADLHPPKLQTNIYDFDVKGQPILKRQLDKRIEYYMETGESIRYF